MRKTASKEYSLAILGNVFDVEISLRRILKEISKQVPVMPEAIIELKHQSGKIDKRGRKELRKAKEDVLSAIDSLSIGEIEELLRIEPSKIVGPEIIVNIIIKSIDFSDMRNAIKSVAPSGTLLSQINKYILLKEVDESEFLRLLHRLVELRNSAGHWHPLSQEDVDNSVELRMKLIGMLRLKIPKTLEQQLSQLQFDPLILPLEQILNPAQLKLPTPTHPNNPMSSFFEYMKNDPITGTEIE